MTVTPPQQRSLTTRLIVAVAVSALAVALHVGGEMALDASVPSIVLYVLAIGFSAWYGGSIPALVALFLSVAIGDLTSQAFVPDLSWRERAVQGFALVITGILTSAMVLFRATHQRMLIERELDASARRRTEENLQHERNRMQVLLEHSPDHIYFKDLESRFVLFSPSLREGFGVNSVNEVIGKTDFDFFTREHAQQAYDDEQEIIKTGKPIIGKVEKETWNDGRVTFASTTKVALRDQNGAIIGTFGITRDITKEFMAQEALRAAKSAAEAATLAKSQFLANMSHELRTPLGAIIGMSEILLESGLNDEQLEFASIIHKSGNNLVAMLNDILDFSKNDAGHLELEHITFDLTLAIDEVVHLHAANADTKELELIQRIEPNVPNRLLGDPARLRQIISNLLGNAIKFTDNGHVYIDVSGKMISEDKAEISIRVTDTGIGIPPDKLESIFEEFNQADTSTTRRFGGTGLGLAICRQLAEGMHGSINATSEPQVGSTFTLRLPFSTAPTTATKLPAQRDLSSVRILIIETNPLLRRVFAELLTAWGCQNTLFQNAQEALAAIEKEPYDIAIIDAHLNDMGGLELGPLLRRNNHGKALGLVLLTTIGRRGDAREAEASGFNAYLVKPVRQLDLHETILTVLEGQASGHETGLITRHSLAENRGHSSTAIRRQKRSP